MYTSDSIYFILPLSKQDSFYFFPPDSDVDSEVNDDGDGEEEEHPSNSEADHEDEEEVGRKASTDGSSSFEEIELPNKK